MQSRGAVVQRIVNVMRLVVLIVSNKEKGGVVLPLLRSRDRSLHFCQFLDRSARLFQKKNPESGIRTMNAVTEFAIQCNSFEGTLPGSGLQEMRAVTVFHIHTNTFKGMLPESGTRTMSAVT
eukprot:4051811-Amphidinium_carterae.1